MALLVDIFQYKYIEIKYMETIQNDTTNIKYFAQGIIIGIILFALNLELNPRLGNILIRRNSKGKRIFNIFAILDYFKTPFVHHIFWKPKNWDLNVYIISLISGVSWFSFRKIFDFFR